MSPQLPQPSCSLRLIVSLSLICDEKLLNAFFSQDNAGEYTVGKNSHWTCQKGSNRFQQLLKYPTPSFTQRSPLLIIFVGKKDTENGFSDLFSQEMNLTISMIPE